MIALLYSCGFQWVFVLFSFMNESKDLSYPETGILWGPGAVSLKGPGGHFMIEIFVRFLAYLEIDFQVRFEISSLN